ncbi:TetR/AcrR family transcriptional regulator [Mycolicibacterium hodleri]|uniref:TetR/AcrR family transcriptional regulator n=1 Tax=Mycolicibacterium hodleri TaxID=49897 RepID=UPI0013764801|nr:TetR/AcrR family transcriptional regulator [Mycolicibacterium hodleri]
MPRAERRRRLTQSERVAQSGQRLMEAAIELFAEKGFERTSSSEIADRAGYSHSMVTARFGSKEALLLQLMHTEYERRMLPPVDPADGIAALLLWVDTIREEIRKDPRCVRAFYTLVFEAVGPIPSLQPWVDDWLTRCVRHATGCLVAAQQSGELRDDVDIDAEAELFVYSGVGLGYKFVNDGDLSKFDESLAKWHTRFDNAHKLPPSTSKQKRPRTLG